MAGIAFSDLAQVSGRECHPTAIEVKGNLLSVRTCSQCALSHVCKAEFAENLGGLRRREHAGETKSSQVDSGHKRLSVARLA